MTDHLITDHGAPETQTGDVRASILRAWDAAQAGGGGDVVLPDRPDGWRMYGPLVLPPAINCRLVARTPLQQGFGGGYLIADTPETPYISFHASENCGLKNLTIIPNVNPEPHDYKGISGFGAAVSIEDHCGDITLDRVHLPNTWDAVNVGTPLVPRGSRSTTLRDCSLSYRHRGVQAWGSNYLYILGGQWQDNSGPDEWDTVGVGLSIWIGGQLHQSATDGVFIGRGTGVLFVEHCHAFLRLAPSANGIANIVIDGVLIDGADVCGIWASPSGEGVINQMDIRNVRINVYPPVKYTPEPGREKFNFPPSGFPIILEQSGNGRIGGVNVWGLTGMGSLYPPVSFGGSPGMVRDVFVDGARVA